MSDEAFNMSLRKFLKTVGVTSQREIESAVRSAANAPSGEVSVRVSLTCEALNLNHEVNGTIQMPGND